MTTKPRGETAQPQPGRRYRVLYKTPDGVGCFEDVNAKSLAAAAWQVAISLGIGAEFVGVTLLPKAGGAS